MLVEAPAVCRRCGKPQAAAIHTVTPPLRSSADPTRPHDFEALKMSRATISIPKATELLGVSRRTIYNWMAAGKVEYVRSAGGSVRLFVDTLWRHGDGTGLAPGEAPRGERGSAGRTRPGSEDGQ